MISKIIIQNIKGFDDKELSVNLLPNKANVLVAPNGFGKSTISTAFRSLRPSKLVLNKDDCHKKDETLRPLLQIEANINGRAGIYIANNTSNNISSHFNIYVINNRLSVKTSGRNTGTYTSVSGHMSIDEIELVTTIPENKNVRYLFTECKNKFGVNKRIIPNLTDLFSNDAFLVQIPEIYDSLDKFTTVGRKNILTTILSEINRLSGNADRIRDQLDNSWLDVLNQESYFQNIKIVLKQQRIYPISTDWDAFFVFWQLQLIYNSDRNEFKKACKRAQYNIKKKNIKEGLEILNNSQWKKPNVIESDGKLKIMYPHANELSNGQRDIVTLFPLLEIISINTDKPIILIIDEVFDYLDDANLIVAQYYVSQLIEKIKKNRGLIYPIFFTHLNPRFFQNIILNKMNIVMLEDISAVPNPHLKRLIIHRNEATIKEDVAKYLMHYHSGEISGKRTEFRTLSLKESWGDGTIFLQYLIDETNKYLADNLIYDPYAVCLSFRIRIEKLIYDKLIGNDVKQEFLDTHETVKKLEFAENHLGELSEVYYIFRILYNDPAHLHDVNQDKAVVYKLNNKIIKGVIAKMFNYDNNPLSIDSIH